MVRSGPAAQVRRQPRACEHEARAGATGEGRELLDGDAGQVGDHALRLRAPFWASAALDIAAANTVASSYSSWRFHQP